MAKISLSEVLDLKYLEEWKWSPNGRNIAYLLNDGGITDLWCVNINSGDSEQLSQAHQGVSGFSWHPSGDEILYVQDGNLHLVYTDGEGFTDRQITDCGKNMQAPTFSPDGDEYTFICEGQLWICSRAGDPIRTVSIPDSQVIGPAFGLTDPVRWSPDGEKIMFHFRDGDKVLHVGVASREGRLLWRTGSMHDMSSAVCWLDDDTWLFAVNQQRSMVRSFCSAALREDAAAAAEVAANDHTTAPPTLDVTIQEIYRQEARGTPGPLRVSGAWPEPNGSRVIFLTEDDGWAHLYLYDPNGDGSLQQLTFGECEDFGHMGDEPAWAPGGRWVCYASNRTDAGQRQLWLLDVEQRRNYQLTDLPGTSVQPAWSPDGSGQLAFVHCDAHRSANLWLVELDPAELTDGPQLTEGSDRYSTLTQTKPDSWTADKDIQPQEVWFEGAGGWPIHGYLLSPPGAGEDSSDSEYPALVYVHGGPIRQMREGFHPSRPYALFYAYSQYLAHRGYATLLVNFRGGIGYGREFRNGIYGKMGVDDIKDVVAAGNYLKDLPYVDESRVGVWGLSYGGYMTLTALTKYPEEFRMGINLAGIWDFAQWIQWIHKRHGRHMGGFDVFFRGTPEQNPELYRVGSPCTYRENLKRPLINFHGTADANVDFAQMDRIVKDCLALGAQYEAYYYPDEAHSFEHRSTWADAFCKIERELDKHLKQCRIRRWGRRPTCRPHRYCPSDLKEMIGCGAVVMPSYLPFGQWIADGYADPVMSAHAFSYPLAYYVRLPLLFLSHVVTQCHIGSNTYPRCGSKYFGNLSTDLRWGRKITVMPIAHIQVTLSEYGADIF